MFDQEDDNQPLTGRSLAREIIVQVLFEDDLNPNGDQQLADQFVSDRMQGKSVGLSTYTREMLESIRQSKSLVDAILEESADNWSLSRMAPTDRNILRQVVIHEAVELAKRFGTQDSPRFVNGVLDRIFDPEETES